MATGKGKKPQNSKKAEAAYDEIDEGGFDLKALIAAQKDALAQKQAANTKQKKATKQSLMAAAKEKVKLQAAQIAQMQEQLANVQGSNAEDRKQLAADEIQRKAAEKEEAETKKLLREGAGIVRRECLKDYAQNMRQLAGCERAMEEYRLGGDTPSGEELHNIRWWYACGSTVPSYFLHNRVARAAKKAVVQRLKVVSKWLTSMEKKKSLVDNLLGGFERDDKGTLSMRASARKGLALLGGKIADKAKQPFTKMYEGIAKHAHSFMDNNPKTANALRYVGGKVATVATNVRDMGKEAFSWIGKKLSFLGGMLRRFLKVPDLGGQGMFGNLLALAALLPTIIGPALKGINAELERRFGEHYIKDFISSMWDKSWGFLTDKVKQLLGIGDSAAKKSEAASNAMLANPTKENTKAASDAYAAKLDERSANSGTGFGNKNDPELAKFAELQKANPWSVQEGSKDRVKAAMQQQKDNKLGSNGLFGFFKNTESLQKIVDAAPEGAIDAAMEKELTAMGVTVRGRSGPRRDGKQSTTPRLGTVPVSAAGSMDGAPVTVAPNSDNAQPASTAGAGRGSMGSAGGIKIPMVPFSMSPEIAPAINTLIGGR